jgi:hypothetical protein
VAGFWLFSPLRAILFVLDVWRAAGRTFRAKRLAHHEISVVFTEIARKIFSKEVAR